MPAVRNTLFVIIDQFRADLLHGALADHVDLPNLRALMGESVCFENHFSVCNPCGPSRASILTGQYAMNHRAVRNGTPLAGDTPNLARALRKVGQRPMLFGYTDTARDPRGLPARDPDLATYEQVMPGFDEVLEMRMEESWPWRADLLAKGYDVPPYPLIFRPNGDEIDDPALYSAADSDTAFLTDCVMRDLAARPAGWFAHVTYLRPHPPLVAPAPYNKLYDPMRLPPPAQSDLRHLFHDHARSSARVAAQVVGFPDLPDSETNIARLRALYLGLASEVDHHIGRLMAMLRARGLYDDTLIVVTSDHGEMLGDHGLWGKMGFHEKAYHTPLLIRMPGQTTGHRVTAPTESIDIAPTLLTLLGAAVPDSMDGHSLVPFLTDPTPPANWREATFSELDFGNPLQPTHWQTALALPLDQANLAILRDSHHTLVQFATHHIPPLLFARGDEGRNLAQDPAHQGTLLEMTQTMLRHRMRHPNGQFNRILNGQGGAIRGTA